MRHTPIICLFLFSAACETMPPQAEQHATALLNYHNKTAAATVACFDKAVAGGDFAVATLGGQVEALWRAYVSDIDEAGRSLQSLRDAAVGVRGRLADRNEPGLAQLIETLDAAAKAADGQLGSLRKYHSDATAAMRDDIDGIADYKRSTATAASDLRLLIQEHQGKVAEGIELHRQLCASYTLVSTARNAFFGGKFDAARKDAEQGAFSAFDKLSKVLDPYLEAGNKLTH